MLGEQSTARIRALTYALMLALLGLPWTAEANIANQLFDANSNTGMMPCGDVPQWVRSGPGAATAVNVLIFPASQCAEFISKVNGIRAFEQTFLNTGTDTFLTVHFDSQYLPAVGTGSWVVLSVGARRVWAPLVATVAGAPNLNNTISIQLPNNCEFDTRDANNPPNPIANVQFILSDAALPAGDAWITNVFDTCDPTDQTSLVGANGPPSPPSVTYLGAAPMPLWTVSLLGIGLLALTLPKTRKPRAVD